MDVIEQANTLVQFALSAEPMARLSKIQAMAPVDEDGTTPKAQVKKMNKLLMAVLRLRDEVAVELQQEAWRAVQLPLFGAGASREDGDPF